MISVIMSGSPFSNEGVFKFPVINIILIMHSGIQNNISHIFKPVLFCGLLLLFFSKGFCQSDVIGIIDFYGGTKVNEKDLRKAIIIKEGDSLSRLDPAGLIKKLKILPGIKQADLISVCCEASKGRSVLYIGVSDKDTTSSIYHKSFTAKISLPKEITETYSKFQEVFVEGIIKGESGEDGSQGHSLMNYAPARTIQEKFIVYASNYLPQLKKVLKNSGNAEQRAIAASVIAYAKDKKLIIDDLLYAVYDNNEEVRNNATRALDLIAAYANKNPELKIKKISADPFIKMMNSIIWTDRNKGAAMLLALTENRDSFVLKQLEKEALSPVIEMAHWKNTGHAMMGYLLLGRLTGFSDEEIYNAFGGEKKNLFLDEMVKKLKEN